MKFKSAFLAALLVIGLLSPLALLLRTQQPWNCFQRTYDESYFLQAVTNWADGKGFRTHAQLKPFDPGITIGLPMAWGATLIKKLTGLEWTQSARFWVYLNFYFLLALVTWAGIRRGRTASSGLIALALFGYAVCKAPAAPYATYGILGEIPAAVFAILALFALDGRRFVIAGLLGVIAFFIKPTFLFFIPALALAAFIAQGSRIGCRIGWRIAVTGAGAILLIWFAIAFQRGESLLEYWRTFSSTAASISLVNRPPDPLPFLNYFKSAGWVTTLFSIAIVLLGISGGIKIGQKEPSPLKASEWAAWLFFVLGVFFYLCMGAQPVPKQWFVFYLPGAAVIAIRAGTVLGPKLARLFQGEVVTGALIASCLIWMINVPSFAKREFDRTPETACPVKEQEAVDRILVDLQQKNEIAPTDVAVVAEMSWFQFPYKTGWNLAHYRSWGDLLVPPRFVTGDLSTVLPAPVGCKVVWKGSAVALLECELPASHANIKLHAK